MARPVIRRDRLNPRKFIVEYRGADKKQHRLKGFLTKKAAEEKAAEIERELRIGVDRLSSTSPNFSDACKAWLKRAEDLKLEKKTRLQYGNHVELHLIPLEDTFEVPAWPGELGNMKLTAIRAPTVLAVRRELTRRLSAALSRKVMVSFKSILNEAVGQGKISFNPAHGIKSTELRRRGEEHVHAGENFPTKEEMATIINVLNGRWRPLIITAAFTGLRASEIRGLEWIDVLDLDRSYPQIRVRQRADADGIIGRTKSDAAHRHIPLTPLIVTELQAWRGICPRNSEGHLRFVFPNGQGRVENHANIWNRGWIPVQIKAGIVNSQGKAKYGVHALRHFYASLLIDQGFNAKRVQSLLGHATIAMTLDVYSHLFREDQKAEASRFAVAEAAVLDSIRDDVVVEMPLLRRGQ